MAVKGAEVLLYAPDLRIPMGCTAEIHTLGLADTSSMKMRAEGVLHLLRLPPHRS